MKTGTIGADRDVQLQLLLACGGPGARYKTPVGPIRVDFSYNLNPPVYPVFYDYTRYSTPYVGKAATSIFLQHRTELSSA